MGCGYGTAASRVHSRPKPGHLHGLRLLRLMVKATWPLSVWCDLQVLNYIVVSWISVGYSRFPYTKVMYDSMICLIFEIRRVENLAFYVNSVWSYGVFIFTSLETWHELLRIQRKKDLSSSFQLSSLATGMCNSHKNSL